MNTRNIFNLIHEKKRKKERKNVCDTVHSEGMAFVYIFTNYGGGLSKRLSLITMNICTCNIKMMIDESKEKKNRSIEMIVDTKQYKKNDRRKFEISKMQINRVLIERPLTALGYQLSSIISYIFEITNP